MNRRSGVKAGVARQAAARLRSPADAWTAVALGFLLVALVVVVGCSGSDADVGATTTSGSADEGSLVVRMVDSSYQPQTLTIKAGDTVTWVNQDSASHNAVADDDSWRTDVFGQDGSGSVTFDTPGAYPYICTLHVAMKGTIIVE